jgi:hypothetical protein
MLVEAIRANWSYPIACVELDFSAEQLTWCEINEVRVIRKRELEAPSTLWSVEGSGYYAKPYAVLASPWTRTIYLDSDTIPLRNLDRLGDWVEKRAVFTTGSSDGPIVGNSPDLYKILPAGRDPIPAPVVLNSGVLAVDHERDKHLLSLWKHATDWAVTRGDVAGAVSWWDQGTLIWAVQAAGAFENVVTDAAWNFHAIDRFDTPYLRDSWLARLTAQYPGVNILHFNARPKLWELLR